MLQLFPQAMIDISETRHIRVSAPTYDYCYSPLVPIHKYDRPGFVLPGGPSGEVEASEMVPY